MANEFKHNKTGSGYPIGSVLTESEWESGTTHVADGQTLGDSLWFDGTSWVRIPSGIPAGARNFPTGRTAAFILAASNSSAQAKAQADLVCDGVDDHLDFRTAAVYHNIYLAEGTYYLNSFTQFLDNTRVFADNISIVGNYIGQLLRASNNLKISGRFISIDGSSTTNVFLFSDHKTGVIFDADVLAISGFKYDAFGLDGGSYIKLIGNLYVADVLKGIIGLQGGQCLPSYLTIKNIHASWTQVQTRNPLGLGHQDGTVVPTDLLVSDCDFDGNNVPSLYVPIVCITKYGNAFIHNAHFERLKFTDYEADTWDLIGIDGLTVRDITSEGGTSHTGVYGSAFQCDGLKNALVENLRGRNKAYSILHIDLNYGACRHVTLRNITGIDCAQKNPSDGGLPKTHCAVAISSTKPDETYGGKLLACFLYSGGTYIDYTLEANQTPPVANSFPLMGIAPAIGDRIVFIKAANGSGQITGLSLKYDTPGVGDYEYTYRYLSDSGIWKDLPGVDDPSNNFKAAIGAAKEIKWDWPPDAEISQTINGVSGYCYCAELTTFNSLATTPLGTYIRTRTEAQDILIDGIVARNEMGVTQLYGIAIESGVRRLRMTDFNELTGNTTAPIYVGDNTDMISDITIGKSVFSSKAFDLSGAADDEVIFLASQDTAITIYRAYYTEASSADAGVVLRVGKVGTTGVADEDYFSSQISEVSKAAGYIRHYGTNNLAAYILKSGEQLTVGTAGGKVGDGEVRFEVQLLSVG